MEHQPAPTFGALLRHLRLRARLTQRDLAIAVNYSEAQICRLEQNRRAPDLAMLVALFFPALGLDDTSEDAAQLLALAAEARVSTIQGQRLTIRATITQEHITEDDALISHRSARVTTQEERTATVAATNLPLPPMPLIGRIHERATLTTLLHDPGVRLVTVLGPPGVGKTHLALQVAHDMQEQGNTVYYVNLAPVSDPALVLPSIGRALGLESDAGDLIAQLTEAFRTHPHILVLDNVEQVREAAPALANLLRAAPGVTLLTTSQAALHLAAEHILPLAPLPVPNLAALPPLPVLARNDAVALLVARLRAADPAFTLQPNNALAVAAICVQVDGLPLALELVAARGGMLTPQELLSEVARHYPRLYRRTCDLPARQQSLQAALDWSVSQLDPAAQRLFAWLGVGAGPWTLEAIRALATLDPAETVLEALTTLCEHSLVQRHHTGAVTYFTLLRVIREDALARLSLRGEEASARNRHLAYYVELAERAAPQLTGPEQIAWLERLDHEHDQLRAALDWACSDGATLAGLRLGGALWRFWYTRGYAREGRDWLERLLALADTPPAPLERAPVQSGAGILAWQLGEYQTAAARFTAALHNYEAAEHRLGVARVLGYQGLLAEAQGNMAQAAVLQQQSLEISRTCGDTLLIATALHNLGNLANHQNDLERATTYYQECLDYYGQLQDTGGMALLYLGLGTIAHDQGDLERALEWFDQSLNMAQQIGDAWTTAQALVNLGEIRLQQGDEREGERLFNESLAQFTALGALPAAAIVRNRMAELALRRGEGAAALVGFRESLRSAHTSGAQAVVAEALDGIAECLLPTQAVDAVRLLAAAAMLRERTGHPIAQMHQARYQQLIKRAQGRLDPAEYHTHWREGQNLSVEAAVTLGLLHTRGPG